MEGTKRSSLGARKKLKRKKCRRLVRSIVTYLKSDTYLFAPLFSNFPPLTTEIDTPPPSNSKPSTVDDISMEGFESLGIEKLIKKRRMSEKVKEYLKSDCYMYSPMISSPPKLGSSVKGKMQITMEVSTKLSTTTMKEDDSGYRNLRSDIAEQTLHKGRINSPKPALVILEGQRTGLGRETDLSPAFSSPTGEKMVKPDQRRVTIE
ncbi:hypothetical protein AtNW77_Chr5g0143661 [Arabidopsis thaliana]|uniref:Uncharacterized protein n=5 Tax=Arabidopsis TaxID=3701 RepID=A0A654GC33_ARATH|nr:uncharacterized protein AT5G57790 [Arabidopsis thaliana]KAG7606461.1 hypothetical protein ISN45_At05g053730 [Arabidopsis thaliana x Arabidopsis arenosa]KAG7613376.1 hypothetical protein ISN44_As05g052980 [Arabidopsis suecica]ANM68665.1 hypothetical protein AT5G57790 [Arabidopsis thaliana]CAA0410514.1 unnamed protein product [Arabidopsis thaliana]VYS70690.1 unnamed protein product [Arabidopsis thaliana]|eukprot:NP_001330394.1 hypothetical protein AT5G57790 [Arabidopsis thaliana]